MNRKKILILTTSVFTDRIYQYSTFINAIKNEYDIEIWARSFVSNQEDWKLQDIDIKQVPKVNTCKHWINILRRINEYAWMYSINAKSLHINQKYKRNQKEIGYQKFFGKAISFFYLHIIFEKFVQILIIMNSENYPIQQLLKKSNADYLLVSNPFWVEEPLIALEAKKLKIPIISIIPSWDNITTKSRIIYKSVAYGVWSSIRLQELAKYYPSFSKQVKFLYGTPQYDIFTNKGFINSNDEFLEKYQLNNQLPIVLFTLGSPLFIPSEINVCLEFCKLALENDLLNSYQILIRPHPIKDFSDYLPFFAEIDSRIRIQTDVNTPSEQKYRFQNKEMINNWVSTFYNADIVIATSSTTILDASMLNKKHINIAANLTSDKTLDSFLHDISFGFEHLQELNKLKLLNNVTSFDDMIYQLKENIINPEVIPNNSKQIVEHLAEFPNNGNYGEIFAKNLIHTIHEIIR